MVADFIITFRETLEAALIVGIILGYLVKIKQTKYNNVVYIGIVFGILFSIIGALIFSKIAGGFSGRNEEVFEGVMMFIGAMLLTTMILWLLRQKHVAHEIKDKVDTEIAGAHRFGLFLLVFISVFREGIETVIFLGASSIIAEGNSIYGAILGIFAAVILGYAIFVGSLKINIKKFFNITSVVLIFFAAGLVAHSVHEFQEAKIIPMGIEHIWDINPAINPDGSYPVWHENGFIGEILKGLFGYNGNPSLFEIMSYLFYLLFVIILWRNIDKVHKVI